MLVRQLLDAGGVKQLQAKDNLGRLPIYCAAARNASAAVVAQFVRSGPWQLRAQTDDGLVPLQVAGGRPETICAQLRSA